MTPPLQTHALNLPPLVRVKNGHPDGVPDPSSGALDQQRRELGLRVTDLAATTGLPYHRVRRAMSGYGRPRRHELAALRAALDLETRCRRSSDPALLRAIGASVIPWLRARLRARTDA